MRRNRGWLAWHIAALSRVDLDKVPLEAVTGDQPVAHAQSPDDMLAVLRLHKRVHGLKSEGEGRKP